MRFRFRYLGPDGSEVEVESLDGLRDLMRSGTVGELTLLFDGLTREWAPARAHAVYRFLRDEMEALPTEPSAPPPPSTADKRTRRGPAGSGGGDFPDLGFAVEFEAPPLESESERAIQMFLREREEEGKPAERVESFATPPAAWSPPSHQQDTPEASPPPAPRPVPLAAVPSSAATPPWATPASTPPRGERNRAIGLLERWLVDATDEAWRLVGHRSVPPTLILAGLVGLILVLFVVVRKDDVVVRKGDPTDARAVAPTTGLVAASMAVGPNLGELVARSALAKASGFQNMVAGMDSLRRVHNVVDVPPVWLEGVYLADASRYPEVESFWLRYQEFLRDVEASDTELFRRGFVQQVANEEESDAVLSMRLSRAMRDFKNTQPERAAVYTEMEHLSDAALALHGLLVEREDDIDYDPAIQLGLSREPVVEAVAQDTVLHDRMWSLLERIFASLEKLGGDLGASRDNLTDMMLQGVEATSR